MKKKTRHQLHINLLIVFVAIAIITFEMPKKMPSFKRSFLSGGTTRFRHLGCAKVGQQAQRCYNPSLWMSSLIIHIAQPCLLSKAIQEKNWNNKCSMPMDKYPCVANCCLNSDCINNKTNLIKSSVVCLCSGAHPWLCARCQRSSREPQKWTLTVSRTTTQSIW